MRVGEELHYQVVVPSVGGGGSVAVFDVSYSTAVVVQGGGVEDRNDEELSVFVSAVVVVCSVMIVR